jgi:hypothetical protein
LVCWVVTNASGKATGGFERGGLWVKLRGFLARVEKSNDQWRKSEEGSRLGSVDGHVHEEEAEKVRRDGGDSKWMMWWSESRENICRNV